MRLSYTRKGYENGVGFELISPRLALIVLLTLEGSLKTYVEHPAVKYMWLAIVVFLIVFFLRITTMSIFPVYML